MDQYSSEKNLKQTVQENLFEITNKWPTEIKEDVGTIFPIMPDNIIPKLRELEIVYSAFYKDEKKLKVFKEKNIVGLIVEYEDSKDIISMPQFFDQRDKYVREIDRTLLAAIK